MHKQQTGQRIKRSYSQFGQDLNVISFFQNKNNLFFIDIGASDGKRGDNTYLLEKKIQMERNLFRNHCQALLINCVSVEMYIVIIMLFFLKMDYL